MSSESDEITFVAASNAAAAATAARAAARASSAAVAAASAASAASSAAAAAARAARASAAVAANATEAHAANTPAPRAPAHDAGYMINAGEGSWSGVLPPYQQSPMEEMQLEGSYELMLRRITPRLQKEETARYLALGLKEELKAGAAFEIATTVEHWAAPGCVHPQCPRRGGGMAASDCYVAFSLPGPLLEQLVVCWECLEELWPGENLAVVLGGH